MHFKLIIFFIFSFQLQAKVWITPTSLVDKKKLPVLMDDMDYKLLDLAIDRQLMAYKNFKSFTHVKLGDSSYKINDLKSSLIDFKYIIKSFNDCLKYSSKRNCHLRSIDKIKKNFNFYQAETNEKTKFTGYYTPVYHASSEQSVDLSYAVYKKPKKNHTTYSRVEIDLDKKLSGQNLELGYIKSPFDIYKLHVEGGGKLIFPNGDTKYISYNGTNKQSFRFISVYMKEQGMIEDLKVVTQEKFLKENPWSWREIYEYCPSYVFFKETDHPPYGVDNIILTDGRSMAQDNRYYRVKGLLGFVNVESKESDSIKVNRFFLDQDTGGAIKGVARADLYLGEDKQAQENSDKLTHFGRIYYLVGKKYAKKY